MSPIPPNIVTTDDILEWQESVKQLRLIKAREMLLRRRIFTAFFPTPHEGTNKAPLANGWELKGGYTLNREVDGGAFMSMRPQLLVAGIRVDDIVRFKPELAKTVYNELVEGQRHLFDQCLVIKEGSPTLEIVLPAKAKAKLAGGAV